MILSKSKVLGLILDYENSLAATWLNYWQYDIKVW